MKELKDLRLEINNIDHKMADLFVQRMEVSKEIALYKKEHSLAIFDPAREKEVIEKNLEFIKDENLKNHYHCFIKAVMDESKKYQSLVIGDVGNKVRVNVSDGDRSYDIHIERGSISKLKELLDLNRRVAIISDDMIPEEYVEIAKKQCQEAYVIRFPHGESHKTLDTYKYVIDKLKEYQFSRKDVILSIGGGITSDLAGYVASTYMRGIDFYSVPTTLLSQVDASIGGKVGLNFEGIKNMIGAFYQPKAIVIDVDTLKTLPERLFNEGLAEVIKMAATSDKELFELLENSKDIHKDIDEVISRSIMIKKHVVEVDEKEQGLRRVLNFGHTYGHAIESVCGGEYFHGECIAIGMLYMCEGKAKDRIEALLHKYHLPTHYDASEKELLEVIKHDKKADHNKVTVIKVKEIGSFEFDSLDL